MLICSRRGKLGVLTRKQNEIQALLDDEFGKTDIHTIKLKCETLENILEEFVEFQKSVLMLMSQEEQECDQMDWFVPKEKRFREFLRHVKGKMEWAAHEEQINDYPEKLPDIRPVDSVSHRGSTVRSTTSSTTRRLRAQAEAERAALLVHATMLEKKHQMEIEEAGL